MSEKQNQIISRIVKILKVEFKPSRIFLFGSRVQGTAHADSDYDFVLVVPSRQGSRLDNMTRARSLIHQECHVSADVFVYTQQEFDEWKDELNSIPETAKNTGREIDLG